MTQHPRFRFRNLLDPSYTVRRLSEIRSAEDFIERVVGLGRYGWGLLERLGWEIRGVPRLFTTRGAKLYYAVRGALFPGIWHDRSSSAAAPATRETRPVTLAEFQHPDVLGRTAALARSFQEALPFKHLVIDGFLLPEFCARISAEFPRYDADKFRNEHNHLGKAHHEKIAEIGPAFAELDRYLQSPEFLGLMSEITGIPGLMADPNYLGGGTHENLEDMELDPHVDFTLHPHTGLYRRVNLLLYLNPEWEESWGGALELHVNPWLPPERNPIRTIPPLFNRCVIFETGNRSWHGFRAIRLPSGKKGLSRRSVAAYLYTRDDPRGIPAIPSDLTVFVDRPLPADFKAGHTLTEEDVRLLSRLIVRRDWKLEYLYGRAIALFNDWLSAKSALERERKAAAASE